MSYLRPVVLSGGSGTRLWPLSTPELPKQFVSLFDGRSLFDMTLARLDGMEGVGAPLVVTGSSHRGLVEEALGRAGVEDGRVLVEPEGRNTAPAAIAAALAADPDDVLVIVPADHLISDVDGFGEAVQTAAAHARRGGIVTFGIRPSRPETGYGYIEIGEALDDDIFEVRHFKEKPGVDRAADMVADGRHFWNSGMFVATSAHLVEEATLHCPGIVDGVRKALPDGDASVMPLADSFRTVEADSIDYAIMEKTEHALVVPIDVGWDDVGSYRSLLTAVERDSSGNHIDGDVVASDVTGSFVRATSRRIVVAGMRDIVVVESPDTVLIVPLDRSQDVRDLASRVESD